MSLLQDAIHREQTGTAQRVGLRWGSMLLDVVAWSIVLVLLGVATWAGLRAYARWNAEIPLPVASAELQPRKLQSQPPTMVEVTAARGNATPAVAALYVQAREGDNVAAEVVPIKEVEPELLSTKREDLPGDGTAVAQPEPLIDVDAIVAEAERALSKPVQTEHPAPFLGELAQAQRDRVPTLRYEQHRFESAQPSAAVVLINGRELRAGDQLPNGVRLLEVLPDSAVFDSDGLVFRLRALSSWVNF